MSFERTTQWMETHAGKQFFLPVTEEMIDIEDIAHALSMQCRYAGHTKRFYSVAEHSCLVSDWVWRNSLHLDNEAHRIKTALAALLHDASEAYLVDIPKPIKPYLANYRELEEQIEVVIADKYGFEYPYANMIKEADVRILLDERAQLFDWSGHDWELPVSEPLGVHIDALSPREAKAQFLERFKDYT